jgi:hypothetical protein
MKTNFRAVIFSLLMGILFLLNGCVSLHSGTADSQKDYLKLVCSDLGKSAFPDPWKNLLNPIPPRFLNFANLSITTHEFNIDFKLQRAKFSGNMETYSVIEDENTITLTQLPPQGDELDVGSRTQVTLERQTGVYLIKNWLVDKNGNPINLEDVKHGPGAMGGGIRVGVCSKAGKHAF